MYIGKYIPQIPTLYIIIEKYDNANDILDFMNANNIFNIGIDGRQINLNKLESIDFRKTLFHITGEVKFIFSKLPSANIFSLFPNVSYLDIKEAEIEKNNKEIFDLCNLENLNKIRCNHDKRLHNFFNHPKIKDIEIFNFKERDYIFPQNYTIRNLIIEKSVPCKWDSLTNFKNLESLTLANISSITDLSWIKNLKQLTYIALDSCKNIQDLACSLSKIHSLKEVFLERMGTIETLMPLKNLNLSKIYIEGGRLIDKNLSFVKEIPTLSEDDIYISMSNCVY